MTKQDWRDLAEARLIDADILLQNSLIPSVSLMRLPIRLLPKNGLWQFDGMKRLGTFSFLSQMPEYCTTRSVIHKME